MRSSLQRNSVLVVTMLALLVLCGRGVSADPVTKPHTFSSGGVVSASQFNENFDTLYDSTAAGIDSTNLASDNEHHWRNAYYIWVKEE